MTCREVPEAMVALVGTAVSAYVTIYEYDTQVNWLKLYVALLEWRSGTFHAIDFTENPSRFQDVYEGHIEVLSRFLETEPGAFHLMMVDVYMLAR
jgi:hypothetical protein